MLLNIQHLQEVSGNTDQPSKGTGGNTGSAGRSRLEGGGVGSSSGSGEVARRSGGGLGSGAVGISRRSRGRDGTVQIVSHLLIGEDRAGLTYQPPGQTDEVTVVYVLVRVQGQLVTVKVVA